MAFGDLLKGAGDMLNKVKDTLEEATGVDLDGIVDSVTDKLGDAKDFVTEKVGDVSEAVTHPGDFLDKAKETLTEVKDSAVGKVKEFTSEEATDEEA